MWGRPRLSTVADELDRILRPSFWLRDSLCLLLGGSRDLGVVGGEAKEIDFDVSRGRGRPRHIQELKSLVVRWSGVARSVPGVVWRGELQTLVALET